MKVPSMIAAEFRRLTASPMARIALVALMMVPVLYAGLYLWANQDPYGRLSEVPVALVDADAGVPASETQDAADYGAHVTEQLLESKAFDWREMSQEQAGIALEKGDVDFVVTIPADFSEALVSVSTETPRQARIGLETNDANNYLASTIGAQAIERIRVSVAELVGNEAASRLLGGLADVRENLQTATEGAQQLVDGAGTALDGAGSLANGAASLRDGTGSLATGARQVSDGAASASAGAQRLADGASQVAAGTGELAGYADQAAVASQAVTDLVPAVRTRIVERLAAEGLSQEQIDAVLADLDPLGDAIAQANGTVQTAVGRVDQLAAGAQQVSSGANELAGGTAQLASGAAQVADGADSAAGGAAQLADGSAQLRDGLGTLTDGTQRLRDGLSAGVERIPASTPELRKAQASTISDPVAVDSSKSSAAANYGAGLAPFFVALAGWIGIYALFLIVKPVSKRAVTALRHPVRITLAGWLTPGLLGAVQMAALLGVLAIALGFSFANPLPTLGIMALASLTYTAIILALNVWAGSVGQFLGLVLMVLQLVTAGGTFPWQTLPEPLQVLHRILPMGYVVDAMRQLMYGGDLARVAGDVAVLLCWLTGALVLAAIGVGRMIRHRTLRDLQPSLIG